MTKTHVFVSPERPTPERMDPIENDLFVKPRGGLWTSPLEDDTSPWERWCEAEQWWPYDPDEARAWLLDPVADAETYTIDSTDDLAALLDEYTLDNPLSVTSMAAIDFERFFAGTDYVGLTLTEQGEWRTRWSQPGLYGWDCASTLWSEWAFENVRLREESGDDREAGA